MLVLDFYIGNILKVIARDNAKRPHPSPEFPEIKVWYPKRLTDRIKKTGGEEYIYSLKKYKLAKTKFSSCADNIVLPVRPTMIGDMQKWLQGISTGNFIYSMWQGYKKEKVTRDFIDEIISMGLTEYDIHTSGHADADSLKKMVSVLDPRTIVPIHTFAISTS
jgi:ribonuclease J